MNQSSIPQAHRATCPKCGHGFDVIGHYCPHCGASQNSSSTAKLFFQIMLSMAAIMIGGMGAGIALMFALDGRGREPLPLELLGLVLVTTLISAVCIWGVVRLQLSKR